MSGPDSQGRVAYIEDYFFVENENDQRHLLKTIQLDGSHAAQLFSRPRDAMWATSPAGNGEIGQHMALSPIGGRVAFVSGLSPVQMPLAYLHVGTIEIWDIDKKIGRKTAIKAIDQGLSWFPDGKRLAFVRFVERKAATGINDAFAVGFRQWEKVPAVFVRDIESGTESFLHVGWTPVIAVDGQHILVSNLVGQWKQVNVATREASEVAEIGRTEENVIAQLSNRALLLWGDPGPKSNGLLTLRVITPDSRDSRIVVPQIDSRTRVSFGQVTTTR